MANSPTSPLAEQLEKDFLAAFKAKSDETLVSVLRLLKTAVKNAEIAKKEKLTEAEIQKVIAGEMKKRRDAIELYRQGNRADLAAQEEKELAVLAGYSPEQLSEEAVKAIVVKIVAGAGETAAGDFGKIMGQVMREVKGQVDGGMVSRLVKEALAPS